MIASSYPGVSEHPRRKAERKRLSPAEQSETYGRALRLSPLIRPSRLKEKRDRHRDRMRLSSAQRTNGQVQRHGREQLAHTLGVGAGAELSVQNDRAVHREQLFAVVHRARFTQYFGFGNLHVALQSFGRVFRRDSGVVNLDFARGDGVVAALAQMSLNLKRVRSLSCAPFSLDTHRGLDGRQRRAFQRTVARREVTRQQENDRLGRTFHYGGKRAVMFTDGASLTGALRNGHRFSFRQQRNQRDQRHPTEEKHHGEEYDYPTCWSNHGKDESKHLHRHIRTRPLTR